MMYAINTVHYVVFTVIKRKKTGVEIIKKIMLVSFVSLVLEDKRSRILSGYHEKK